ncbi:MAG: TauD/TfdA family dioxygenase [Alphaproteobacteria bacterium]
MTITQTLRIEPLNPVIAARVTGIDLHRPIADDSARELREAFARHAVLCLPDQKITPQDQIAFASLFGLVDANYRSQTTMHDRQQPRRGVMLVSNIRKNGEPIGVLPDGEMHFHSDGAHRDVPYTATTLYAIKVPSQGGDTRFAAMEAAYEALPDDIKHRLDGRDAHHVFNYNETTRDKMRQDDPATSTHPVVRVHPDTGRRSLYVSRLMTRDIIGLERPESDKMLAFLFDHCEKPEFVHAHRWAPGDLVIWDNRCVNHARSDFPPEETRLLRRYTIT